MPTARAGQAAQDCRRLAASLIPDEQTVFTIKADSLHFPFRFVVVNRDRPVPREDVQFIPLVQRVIDRLGHGMFGKQLFFPRPEPLSQVEQDRL